MFQGVTPLNSLFLFNFLGQGGLSSNNWREQTIFCKCFSHWDLFFFFGRRDRIAARKSGVWIDFSLLLIIFFSFLVMFECFCQTQFRLSEIWNIQRFRFWNIPETPWPMWDSLKPNWSFIRIVWLISKINTLDVSRNELGKTQLSLIKLENNLVWSNR